MKKKKGIKDLKSEADKLWGQIVRLGGICLHCGSTRAINAAHIIPRTNLTLRWDLANGLALCYRCHIHWQHQNPLDFADWVARQFPERYAYLNKLKNVHRGIDYVALLEYLKGILDGS